jgi:predicted outer membrane lipoprotein
MNLCDWCRAANPLARKSTNMENLAEQIGIILAAATGVLAALYMGFKAVAKATKSTKDDEVLDQVGKVLDELDIVDHDEDGK